jgi:hypothetical protein
MRKSNKMKGAERRDNTHLVVFALVGTKHHPSARQLFLFSSLVAFLFTDLHLFKAVLAFNKAV